MKTSTALTVLTIATTSLTALAAGLAALPVDSASLPMPPNWRPYLVGVGFIAASIRIVVLPTIEATVKYLEKTKPDADYNPPEKP